MEPDASIRAGSPYPAATYRVQLRPDLGLDGAAEIAGYLEALGITHLYTSPIVRAAPGSTHGYDVVDPNAIDPAIGGRDALVRLTRRLREHGLGHMIDIVPNHMSTATPANPWWWDVLARGKQSRYARFFDIDWEPSATALEGRVLVPVLGRPLAEAIEAGEVELGRGESGELVVRCAGHTLPLIVDRDERRALEAALDADSDAARSLPAQRMLDLLGRQHYALTHWRRARTHLNYRRFFTISSMVCVRMEDPEVFAATHEAVLGLVRDGLVDALRIDHPDGLRDPDIYLDRLARASGGVWTVVEKILGPDERLRPSWRAAGTTGYDFAAMAGGLFIDPGSESALTSLYAEVAGEETHWDEVAYHARVGIMRGALAPEIERLTRLVTEASADGGPGELLLAQAVVEVLASLPVYRTYARPDRGAIADGDVEAICHAAARATERRPDLAPAVAVLRDLLLLRAPGGDELVWRLQQTSGPVMAKAIEDTAMYIYNRFVALNEVGCDPARFGVSVDAFHAFCLERQARWPLALNALSTHDTKRSADVRARLYVLSEMPVELGEAVRRWVDHNRRHRQGDWPDRSTEYLLYQTLIGAHPLPADRARAYMEKAAREAGTHTSWTEIDEQYEEALRLFVDGVLADPAFTDELAAFVRAIVDFGRTNSLALALLCATAPGVPDVYQGSELWDLSLVDPDNRRPVDFDARRAALEALEAEPPVAEILAHADEGWPKLWVLRQALHLRRRWPDVFGPGSAYVPVFAAGPAARHVIAYARSASIGPGGTPEGAAAIACAPRLSRSLGGDWRGTTLALPAGRWIDILSGARHEGEVAVADLLGRFPVALCCMEEGATP